LFLKKLRLRDKYIAVRNRERGVEKDGVTERDNGIEQGTACSTGEVIISRFFGLRRGSKRYSQGNQSVKNLSKEI
jgi:hypothetical protein